MKTLEDSVKELAAQGLVEAKELERFKPVMAEK
jgi:hypothetical protein